METIKKIAIYMDHFTANIIEYKKTASFIKTIQSDFNHIEKEKIIQKGESHLHNKEQDLQNKFYMEISDNSVDYSQILLFGPTNSKTEFKIVLENDKRFINMEIILKITDKLTTTEQIDFVDSCFYLDSI